jgi:hypothetical protein
MRLPHFAGHFQTANAWDWHPQRRYRCVYALWDCVPEGYLTEFVRRLMARFVAPEGQLIMGAYGSSSGHERPFDVETLLSSAGYRVRGATWGGTPPISRFAWVDRDTPR